MNEDKARKEKTCADLWGQSIHPNKLNNYRDPPMGWLGCYNLPP